MLLIKKNLAIISLFILTTLFMMGFYGSVLMHPNDYLFTQNGDGIKNYYTYAYHIQHDSSYINFSGMNYPYGEHYLYTDCHPVVANSFQLISKFIPSVSDGSIGFLNMMMLLSIYFSFFVVYALLRRFRIKKWLSVVFSLSIVILAPQIFRLGGHLALSYSVAIPFSWWLLLWVFEKNKYYFLLFLNSLFWMFIHGYLGIIILFFLIVLSMVRYLFDKSRRELTQHYVKIFLSLLLPILFFFVFAKVTDTHSGRTDNPSGFFLYNAEPDDIFLPHHPPLRSWLDTLTHHGIKLQWEAWSYMGFAVTLLSVFILIIFIYRLISRKKSRYLSLFFQNPTLNESVIAAFIVLLFAMAFPFKQIPALLDVFPILKQFRATGRFTWPFFFVWSIFSAYAFQQLFIQFKERKRAILAYVFIAVVGVFSIVEGWSYHREVAYAITQSPNLFKQESLPKNIQEALRKIDADDYQAIMVLPFYYYASESFARPASQKALRQSILFSYHTGIPMVNAMLTRTAVPESKKIVQLISPDFYYKEIQNDFPNNQRFLIIHTGEALSAQEQALWDKTKSLYTSDEIQVGALAYQDLWQNSANDIIDDYRQKEPQLYAKNHFMLSDSLAFVYYKDFESTLSDTSYRGKGAYSSVKKGKNIFAEFKPNTFDENTSYEVSIWMYNAEPDALNLWFRFIIEEYDPEADKWYSTTYFPEFAETINGDWSLIKGRFKIHSKNNWIYVLTKGKDNSKAHLHADDLLIREEGTAVYQLQSDGSLFFNNDKIEPVTNAGLN